MNQYCYRVIFNKATGAMSVVSELAKSHTQGKSSGTSMRSRTWPRFPMKVIALSLIFQLSGINVVYAEIVADQHAGEHRPDVTQTANHVEQVQIVHPDGNGISHNQYSTFNVNQSGAILNNSVTTTQTVQGGQIGGNPNLQGGNAAHVIVNEVTSTKPSRLNGNLEVAGQRADVVVSNPNGIQVNGFGFLNTNRGTLTTGKPVVTANGLEKLQVTRGQISVDGRGFNDGDTSQVDMIARAVAVNAKIHAKNLNVLGGAAEVNYGDLGATIIQGEGDKPTVAIDVAALGGMYADKIMLVGTEKGVGVSSQGTIESQGDFTLTAQGKIVLQGKEGKTNAKKITAKDQLQITTNDDVQIENLTITAGQNINLHADGTVNNMSGEVTAGKNLNVSANKISNGATGLLNSDGTTRVDGTTVENKGRVYGDDVIVTGQDVINGDDVRDDQAKKAVIAARHNLTIGVTRLVNQEGALLKSEQDMQLAGSEDGQVQSDSITNASATIDAGGNLTTNTKNISNTNTHFVSEDTEDSREHITEVRLTENGAKLVIGRDAHFEDNGEYQYLVVNPGVLSVEEWKSLRGGQWIDDVYQIDNGKDVQTFTKEEIDKKSDKKVQLSLLMWSKYYVSAYDKVTTSTKVTDNAVARIQSAGDMRLSGNVVNDKSQIAAGGTISGAVGDITNTDAKGRDLTLYQNKDIYKHSTKDCGVLYWKTCNHKSKGLDFQYDDQFHDHDLNIAKVESNVAELKRGKHPAQTVYLSQSQLYQFNKDPKSSALMTVDPAYMRVGNKVSSAYMLEKLGLAGKAHIGDGYYEQKLIGDMYLNLTGHPLDSTTNINDVYKTLMDAGLAHANQLGLKPGHALTKEQQANIDTDMVWMVEKDAVLENGQHSKVMVPELYLAHGGNAKNAGTKTMISGKNIDLQAQNINNSGLIQSADNIRLQAANVNNDHGAIVAQNNIEITSAKDIKNHSGAIAGSKVHLAAAHDVVIDTSTHAVDNENEHQIFLDRQGLVSGEDISIDAKGKINVDAAKISSANNIALNAGKDVKIGTVTSQIENKIGGEAKANPFGFGDIQVDHNHQTTVTTNGSEIDAGADIHIKSGHDVDMTAVTATAKGALDIDSANDTRIKNSYDTYHKDTYHHESDDGVLSQSFKEDSETIDQKSTHSSTLSGDQIHIKSGKDIAITGSNVVGDQDVSLNAAHDTTISSSQDTYTSETHHYEDKSGFSIDDEGLNLGDSEAKQDNSVQGDSNHASVVGSVSGNIDIKSGNKYTQIASDINAANGDLNVQAKSVAIQNGNDNQTTNSSSHSESTGFKLGVSSPLLNAVKDVNNTYQRIGESDGKFDKAKNAYSLLSKLNGLGAMNLGSVVDAGVSFGHSEQDQSSETKNSKVHSSTVKAGGNITITATGGGVNSNLDIVGSDVTAGKKTNLKADNAVSIVAGQETTDMQSNQSSISGSVGYSMTQGWNASLGGNLGNTNQHDVTHINSHVHGNDEVTISSGADTNIRGGVVDGAKVTANVGGNLNIESLQDTSEFSSKQKGGSVGVSQYGGVNGSYSHSNLDSTYASVNETSGMKAGDGGFHVNVHGDTDLKGAVIASTDAAVNNGKNTFNTDGKLTTSDIVNKASYAGKGSAVSGSANLNEKSEIVLGQFGAGTGSVDGEKNSVTAAGISGLAGKKDVRSDDASSGIVRIFDSEKEQKKLDNKVQTNLVFSQQAGGDTDKYFQGKKADIYKKMDEAREEKNEKKLADAKKELEVIKTHEHIVNIGLGILLGRPEQAIRKESASVLADWTRMRTIENSSLYKGLKDGDKIYNNLSGESVGVDNDRYKGAGQRESLDISCGKNNQKCLNDGKGDVPNLVKDADGYYVWNQNQNKMSYEEFLKKDEAKGLFGLTGGLQGVKGTIFGTEYESGSTIDRVLESFAGPHDYIGGQVVRLYDGEGNTTRNLPTWRKNSYEVGTVAALFPAGYLAAGKGVSGQVWNVFSILSSGR
jgi:filamentous hemagglutinin